MTIKTIIRDVLILLLAVFIAGGIVGLAGGYGPRKILASIFSQFIFLIAAFTIISHMANRDWFYMTFVSFLFWMANLPLILIIDASPRDWFFSIILISISMVVGVGLSFLFKKKDNQMISNLSHDSSLEKARTAFLERDYETAMANFHLASQQEKLSERDEAFYTQAKNRSRNINQ